MKKWIITGISSGLGQALAHHVLQEGDYVIGTFRKQSQADQFNETYGSAGKAYVLDLSEDYSIETFAQTILDEHSSFDVLVNNAGVGFIGSVEETSKAELQAIMQVNFFGPWYLTKLLLPLLRHQRSGHLIQLSSHGGFKAFAGFGTYNASKFALEGMSEALAQEIAPLGIKLTLVEPGPFRTAFADHELLEAQSTIADYSETAGSFRNKLKSIHGLQEGDPEKAAQAIYALADQPHPPLRLPLGKIALQTIGLKLDQVKADLEAGKTIAEGAVFSR